MDIIEKYEDHQRCENEGIVLPVLSNQKVNSYLKEIARDCHIPQNRTFHLARHTFASTVTLTNGVPIESVNNMVDHLDIKTTKHYAKVIDEKVSKDMQTLAMKLEEMMSITPSLSEQCLGFPDTESALAKIIRIL